ncbi:MAG: threonine--tRNA ligase [Patescibacteria group bacterium]|jgi:threonyl-tRNA synthetase|nr:threonine--tRNA ligase [Patescibacteria group bacterium]
MDDKLLRIRHSASHVLAQAVLELYPDAKLAIGPAIEEGFYYDFDLGGKTFSDQDLAELEKKMRQIIKQNQKFEKSDMDADEAVKYIKSKHQPYKLEMAQDLQKGGEKKLGFYTMVAQDGKPKFVDLCAGPHVKNTKEIGAVKLLKLAGAYWRGDEKNKMLQRIYGTAFGSQAELDEYLKMVAEAEKRDHRKIGKELKIFSFHDMVGSGLPLWLPNGGVMIEEIEKLAKEMEEQAGYSRVKTPHLAKEEMYQTSGHLPYYEESMFPPMVVDDDGRKTKYYLKAMNCPHHHLIFASEMRSYRDLPIRLAEYGTCYRYEKSGELFGLMRVRSMQMNDAHIYCTEDQFESEFLAVIDLYLKYFEIFNIEKYVMRFSTHSKEGLGKKYIDNEKLWLKTEEMIRKLLTKNKVPFVEVTNEAAFYGPKIDVQIWSAIGREFTLATNQVDFAVPERFGLVYVDNEGKEKTPICIHRAPLSTHERLIGFLIEHYAGAFPTWLAPVQVQIVSVGQDFIEFCQQLATELVSQGIRVKIDDANETVGNKIRKAEKQKIPYMLVIGEKEVKGKELSVRLRGQKEMVGMKKEKFVEKVVAEIKNRK